MQTHHFTSTGRRHETPGPETKDSLLLSAVTGAMVPGHVPWFSQLSFPQGYTKEGQVMPAHTAGVLQVKNSELRRPESFILDGNHACRCSGGRHLPISRLFSVRTSLERVESKGQSMPLLAVDEAT